MIKECQFSTRGKFFPCGCDCGIHTSRTRYDTIIIGKISAHSSYYPILSNNNLYRFTGSHFHQILPVQIMSIN